MALSFNGTADIAYSADTYTYGTTFTVSFWIKTTESRATKIPFGFYISDGGGVRALDVRLNVGSAGNVGCYIADAAGTAASNSDAGHTNDVLDGAWHKVVLTRNGTTVRMWVDNEIDSMINTTIGTNSIEAPANRGPFGLGGRCNNATFDTHTQCVIAEAAVWTRTLSTQEINILQRLAPTAIPDGLDRYYPIRGTGVELVGGNDLTISGATFTNDHPPIGSLAPVFYSFASAPASSFQSAWAINSNVVLA